MVGSLAGKVALVSGASRGIGAEIARCFAAAGAKTIVGYFRSEQAAADIVKEIVNAGGDAIAVRADLTVHHQIEALVSEAVTAYDKIDILVNNAATVETGELDEITEAHFEKLFGLNVRAVLQLTKAAVAHFGREGGRVINISSRNGAQPVPGAAVYCATKAAVNAVTASLAQELGSRRITVNAIAPGPIDTASFRKALPADVERALVDRIPLGRLGRPMDVAVVALFLASDEAGWISGEVITASGALRS